LAPNDWETLSLQRSVIRIKCLYTICLEELADILSLVSLPCFDKFKPIEIQSFDQRIWSYEPPNQVWFIPSYTSTSPLHLLGPLMACLHLKFHD